MNHKIKVMSVFVLLIVSICSVILIAQTSKGKKVTQTSQKLQQEDTAVGVSAKEIKIGTFLDLSGALAPICKPIYHGMQAYFKMVNDTGGINKRKIKLIVEDDNGNPAKSLVAVKKLVEEDKVFAIVGASGLGALAVMDYLNKNKVPFIAPGIGTKSVAYPPKRYIFAIQPNAIIEGFVITKYAIKTLECRTFVVIRTMDDLGQEGLEGIKAGISKYGGELVLDIGIPVAQTDFTSEAAKVKKARPDAVVIYALYKTAAAVVKALKAANVDAKIFTTYGNAALEFIPMVGKAGEGMYITAWVDVSRLSDPGVIKYFTAMQTYFPDEQNLLSTAGWIAAEVFCEGLKRAGESPTRESFVKAMETLDCWDGDLIKGVTYKPNIRDGKRSLYFLQIYSGGFVRASDWISVYEDIRY